MKILSSENFFIIILSILSALVLITTILIQIADDKIATHDKTILIGQNEINNYAINKIDSAIGILRYELFTITNPEISKNINPAIEKIKISDKLQELENDYNSGAITKEQFFVSSREYHKNSYNRFNNIYLEKFNNINNLFKQGTPWTAWKIVFVTLNVTFALALILIQFLFYVKFKSKI